MKVCFHGTAGGLDTSTTCAPSSRSSTKTGAVSYIFLPSTDTVAPCTSASTSSEPLALVFSDGATVTRVPSATSTHCA